MSVLTAAVIRSRFPKPVAYDGDPHDPNRPSQACYCVGGAYIMAAENTDLDDATLVKLAKERDTDGIDRDDFRISDEDRFPTEFGLQSSNPLLEDKWSLLRMIWGETDDIARLATAYESAIRGANDNPYWDDPDLELAWQLLDDALTYTRESFDRMRQARLLIGLAAYGLADPPPELTDSLEDRKQRRSWRNKWIATLDLAREYEPLAREWLSTKGIDLPEPGRMRHLPEYGE